jgi:hypothetical protein
MESTGCRILRKLRDGHYILPSLMNQSETASVAAKLTRLRRRQDAQLYIVGECYAPEYKTGWANLSVFSQSTPRDTTTGHVNASLTAGLTRHTLAYLRRSTGSWLRHVLGPTQPRPMRQSNI